MNILTINNEAITPVASRGVTQLIFQRHCDYDRVNGCLTKASIATQEETAYSFIKQLEKLSIEDLENTYFLFTASPTTSSKDLKRCVETTDIAMKKIKEFLESKNIHKSHIMNYNEDSNYHDSIHESSKLTEPKMFTDDTGFFEFLKEKHNGINKEFWIDFEEDLSKKKREELKAEGPDEIVKRAVRYIQTLQRYATYFQLKNPNSRLIIWNGTHYDLLSPLVKQKILDWEKSDIVRVDYCGGISFILNDENITAIVNNSSYPFDSEDKKQPHLHF